MSPQTVERSTVLAHRFVRHGLHHEPGALGRVGDVDLLDAGIQDTGPDGAAWALALRGAPVSGALPPGVVDAELALAWTLRGAPHAYRRRDLADVAVATAPWSEADAAKRVFDAAKPLRDAGLEVLDALGTVASALRDLVEQPTTKGDVSTALTARLDPPFLRACRPCEATHCYEQPFRLAALQAGLELVPGTSPPVLVRVAGLEPNLYGHLASEAPDRFDVLGTYLRFFGPARASDAAAFCESPVREVNAHWPAAVTEIVVAGEPAPRASKRRFVADADLEQLLGTAADEHRATIRLLGPYDPYLQGRDRELLVPDEQHRKALWPVLGRPGAVVAGGEIVAIWRARTSRGRLSVTVECWSPLAADRRHAVEREAERLRSHRGLDAVSVEFT